MARTHRISRYQRCLAGALAALIGLGPLLTPAYAQLTALGDQPIAAQVKAKPNIMLTVDDSSSMLYDFLPDSVIGLPAGPNNYCRDITGRMNAQCGLFDIAIDLTAQGRGRDVSPGYAYEQFGLPYPAYQSTIRLQTLQWRLVAETHRQQRAWRRMQRAGQCGYHLLRRHRSRPPAWPRAVSEPGGSAACKVAQGGERLRVLVAVARARPQQRAQSPLLQPENHLRPAGRLCGRQLSADECRQYGQLDPRGRRSLGGNAHLRRPYGPGYRRYLVQFRLERRSRRRFDILPDQRHRPRRCVINEGYRQRRLSISVGAAGHQSG